MNHLLITGLMTVTMAAQMGAQTMGMPDLSYDSRAPLEWQELLVKDYGFAKLLDVSYASPRGGRVTAYAVVPTDTAHPAGIVWQHWGQGDRSSMLPEALAMARRGAASILVNSPGNRPNSKPAKTTEESLGLWLQNVVDLRRAADALLEHYGARPESLAYVGHSYGATMGGLVAVGERRFRALVLMGGFASISDAMLHPRSGPAADAHDAEVFRVMDADRYIGRAAPTKLLLQFARYDRFVTEEQAKRYAAAASAPKTVRWYECGHELNDPEAVADREKWLAEQLGLGGK
jgi:predicted esterase